MPRQPRPVGRRFGRHKKSIKKGRSLAKTRSRKARGGNQIERQRMSEAARRIKSRRVSRRMIPLNGQSEIQTLRPGVFKASKTLTVADCIDIVTFGFPDSTARVR